MDKKSTKDDNSTQCFFPPVVAVLGHVDHGKTTLLDAIRKTSIAEKEHGGITQKIAASSIEIIHEGEKRLITFIDTPGHEAFSKMRSRGTQAADIGLLIISSTDGVMPQTKESIKLLLEAKIPFIVVLTKVDLADKITEKIKQQLSKERIILEGLGGDVPIIEVSSKTGENIKELLELILLVYDLNNHLWKERLENSLSKAIVIESRLDPKIGPRATIVIKNGMLKIKDEIVCETHKGNEIISGRIRALINAKGQHLQSATIGDAIEVLGFEKVPPVGTLIFKKTEIIPEEKPIVIPSVSQKKELEISQNFLSENILSIILCADTLGSLEAIVNSLPKKVAIILKKTGEVSPSDILLAKSANAIILGFNIKISNDILNLAKNEKVLLKNYHIIYELIDEIAEVVKGKNLVIEEEILGKAKILASFPYEKTKVLGIKVLEGRIARGDRVRIKHDEKILGESAITSVRQGKSVISKVEKNGECGILISPFLDFTIGDMLISHR